ncbi:hypothetical protein CN13_06840 [Petrotoga sp. HKA.pet.4.5]|nr:hypothetical protein CN13_06840 [Petrotoga sp. HKA.pet.4.5]
MGGELGERALKQSTEGFTLFILMGGQRGKGALKQNLKGRSLLQPCAKRFLLICAKWSFS